MTFVLPKVTDLVTPDEFTLNDDQQLRLLDDRQNRSRWRIAEAGVPIPGPHISQRAEQAHPRLVEAWPDPWTVLNDPAADDMAGVCVLDQDDPGQGILIWVHPTEQARQAWQDAWNSTTWRPTMLGTETSIRVAPPDVDYRAVFRYVVPIAQVNEGTVRWRFRRPARGETSWDVLTAGWLPERHKRFGQQQLPQGGS